LKTNFQTVLIFILGLPNAYLTDPRH